MTSPPLTLDELKQLTDPVEMLRSSEAYLDRLHECESTAHALRRKAYRELAYEHGPSQAARMAGVSLTTIKNALMRND